MDVRFCNGSNHSREAHMRAGSSAASVLRAPQKARVERRVFSLDKRIIKGRPFSKRVWSGRLQPTERNTLYGLQKVYWHGRPSGNRSEEHTSELQSPCKLV